MSSSSCLAATPILYQKNDRSVIEHTTKILKIRPVLLDAAHDSSAPGRSFVRLPSFLTVSHPAGTEGGITTMLIQRVLRQGLVGLGCLAAPALSPAFAQAVMTAPEAPTGRTAKTAGSAAKDMVAAANPLAAQAGREILAAGGSAVDAAVAVQLVLNL